MRGKQLLCLFLSLLLMAGLLTSCKNQPKPEDQQGVAPTVFQGEDPYPELGHYTMVIAHAQPEGNPRSVSLEKFAQDVYMATYGHVEVSVMGDSTHGSEWEMLEQCMAGTIQGMRGGQYDFSPRLLMFTLPFLTQNRAQITALLHSDLAKAVCTEAGAATGTVILNLCDAGGYRQFSNNVRPITKPADLQGLRMRTNSMETTAMAFEAMGASTISIPYTDLYISLESGVADGQDNPWINVVNMNFYEVQEYFTEVNYQFHPDPFYVNANWYHDLPQEFQTILADCATEMGTYNDQLVDEGCQNAKKTIDDSSAQVYTPTEEELAAFQEAMAPVYDQCIAEGICTREELAEMQRIVRSAQVMEGAN